MIFLTILKSIISNLIRNIYWLYNLSRIPFPKGLKISLPIVIEGKGIIHLGCSSTISKNASFKIAKGTSAYFGNEVLLDRNIDIRIGYGGKLVAGNNCSIQENNKIYINNEWKFGDNVTIATNCSIFSREKNLHGRLLMANYTFIGDNCLLDISDDIIIETGVAIGPSCTLYTHDHDYNVKNQPAWSGKIIHSPIILRKNAWISSNVTILPGVEIGENAVIAAGAVVTRNVPAYTVWGGVPAKHLKNIPHD